MQTNPPTFSCVVDADLFRRAWACVSTEEARYYLKGVKVEPCPAGGALLISTDGSKLVAIRDPGAHVTGTAIVSLTPAMLKALKAKPVRFAGPRMLVVNGERAAVASPGENDHETRAGMLELAINPTRDVEAFQPADALIDGSFPDWRRVVPTGAETQSAAAFDIAHMQSVAGALSNEGKGGYLSPKCAARVVGVGEDPSNSPHLIFGDGTVDGFGVLMPIRTVNVPALQRDAVPAWAQLASAQQHAAA